MLHSLNPKRATSICAQEILAGLDLCAIAGIERRSEIGSIVAGIEMTFLEWDPEEQEDE